LDRRRDLLSKNLLKTAFLHQIPSQSHKPRAHQSGGNAPGYEVPVLFNPLKQGNRLPDVQVCENAVRNLKAAQ
jgi:hypothetical protein